MEEQYYADRARLRTLMNEHPDWRQARLAEAVGRSLGWVKKWQPRLRRAAWDDETVLRGLSRARQTHEPRASEEVIAYILEVRDRPPENLRRVPGPEAILYYLHKDPVLREQGLWLPRSTRTIWRYLRQHGRIVDPAPREHEPLECPPPMTAWQLDFKDVSTVPPDPMGKRRHVVEVLNTVDEGTSSLVEAQVGDDFTGGTAVEAAAEIALTHGLPEQVTFDRDPRFVGSWSGRDFPAPFVRFWHCLGVRVKVCPPHRPDKNAYVERYHRTFGQECLEQDRPSTLEEAREYTARFKTHYNEERPNQARSCRNLPPAVAFPNLPPRPPVPDVIDPDHWLQVIHDQHFVRKVRSDGTVTVDYQRYYIGAKFAGQYIVLRVDALSQKFEVYSRTAWLRAIPIKGLYHQRLPFQEYLRLIAREAQLRWQRALRHRKVYDVEEIV